MLCGELSRLAGVSADTVRFYERRGLMAAAPRSAAGYRLFPPAALVRVKLVRGALSIGFSVSELATIFRERDRGGAPCHRVHQLATEKLASVEAQLRALQAWRRELRTTLAQWKGLLRKTPRGERAGLLEAFVATHRTGQTRQTRTIRGGELARRNRKREKRQ